MFVCVFAEKAANINVLLIGDTDTACRRPWGIAPKFQKTCLGYWRCRVPNFTPIGENIDRTKNS